MTPDTKKRQPDGEAIDGNKKCLERNDAVDQACKELFGKYRVLFYQLREVVES